jgi:hypothetical protein
MSASSTDLSSSSISSSGHIDGLGRRSLSFDRETGGMLERVHLRPELVPFEPVIRERIARLQSIEHERFARPVRIERDGSTGELTVLSEFVTGSRLSDLLEATADQAIVPGVDVALGYLLEALPALVRLHAAGISHGLIDVSRTVLTPDGQVVFLDPVFGKAVEHLHLSRQRLWAGFGIAAPAGDGAVHLDAQSDISQVALGAVALVLGRNLRPDEYPDALTNLLMEVVEVAQIRGSAAFATGFQRLFQRALPLPGRRPFTNVDEVLADVRQLVRRDLGLEVCRQAVVDFAAQMDAAFAEVQEDDEPDADTDDSYAKASTPERSTSTSSSPYVPELDQFLDSFDGSAHTDTTVASDSSKADTLTLEESDDETELSLESLDLDQPASTTRDTEEVYELSPIDADVAESNIFVPVVPEPPARITKPTPAMPAPVPEPVPAVVEPEFDLSPAPAVIDNLSASRKAISDKIVEPPAPPIDNAPPTPAIPEAPAAMPLETVSRAVEAAQPTAPVPAVDPAPPAVTPPVPVVEAVEAAAPATPPSEPVPLETTEPEKDTASSRRRKRQQQKSARARKDKLRSSVVQKPAPPPPPEPPKPASPSGWLVSPQRAAQFEPPVPPPPMHVPVPPPPPPVRPVVVAAPAVPSFSPTPVGALPQPVYPSGPHTSSVYGTPSAPTPAKPGPLTPPPVVHAPQSSVQVKVKPEPPSGFTPKRAVHSEPPPVSIAPDRFGTLGLGRVDAIAHEEPRAFPWKLAAVAVAVAVIAILIGRTYLPGRSAVEGEPGAQDSATAAPAAAPASAPDPAADGPIPAGRGRLVINTDPPGIRVSLDRKPIGETPIRIDVPPGRKVLTFMTSGGEVIRSVRIVAGKTETLDIPVFSGWVSVLAPIVLTVAADGKNIGSTEQSRLILPPGKHQLTLTNKELGYTATQDVEIEPGEVKTVSVDPKGPVNLNAAPWAEVWLDGQKLGDTPLASTLVPLGIREFVFKNPQFGERKVNTTIKAANNPPVTVDFNK